MNILTLQHDYPIISLTRLSAPVKIIEIPIIDLRVVEGLEGELVEEDDFTAPMLTEAEFEGIVMEEEEPIAVSETEEELDGTMVVEEEMLGEWECDD